MEIKRIDNINFGITYLKPSLQYMSEANRKKLVPSYGLGQLFPVDIFLGADRKGNLTVEIMKTSLWKHLYVNNDIPQTPLTYSLFKFDEAMNRIKMVKERKQIPIEKKTLNFMDLRSSKALPYDIAHEIEKYFKKYRNLFLN